MFDARLFVDNPTAARVWQKADSCWGALGRYPYALQQWVENFEPAHRELAWHLLVHFTYYPPDEIGQLCHTLMLHRVRPYLLAILEEQGIDLSAAGAWQAYRDLAGRSWMLPVRGVKKGKVERVDSSGDIVAYYCGRRGPAPQLRSARDLRHLTPRPAVIVLVDDFIGSGTQVLGYITHLRRLARWNSWKPTPRLVVAALVAMRTGVDAVRAASEVPVLALNVVEDEQRAFTETSRVFPVLEERAASEAVIRQYGEQLWAEHPLGFEDGQLLLALGARAPNNTLPIFWESRRRDGDGSAWHRLVPGSR